MCVVRVCLSGACVVCVVRVCLSGACGCAVCWGGDELQSDPRPVPSVLQAKAAKSEQEARRLRLRSLQYLERYIYLVLFSAYLHLEKAGSWQRPFSAWMREVRAGPGTGSSVRPRSCLAQLWAQHGVCARQAVSRGCEEQTEPGGGWTEPLLPASPGNVAWVLHAPGRIHPSPVPSGFPRPCRPPAMSKARSRSGPLPSELPRKYSWLSGRHLRRRGGDSVRYVHCRLPQLVSAGLPHVAAVRSCSRGGVRVQRGSVPCP